MGRPQKIQKIFHESIIDAYVEGTSLYKLALKFKVVRETIRIILIKNNVKIRSSEEVNKPTEYDKEMLKKLYIIDKKSIKDIALEFKIGTKSVVNALIREKIPFKKKWDYKRKSFSIESLNKIRLSKMGDKNPNYQGKSITPMTIEKKRLASLGKKHTAETKNRMSKVRIELGLSKGDKNPMSKHENVKKWAAANKIKPNKKESKLFNILNRIVPGMFLINVLGDQLIIKSKIPDFVCIKNKIIIELYGDYWHKGEDPTNRINLFKTESYNTLIIREKELNDINMVEKKINDFITKST
jgi:very-short-patch-repair endonuclease